MLPSIWPGDIVEIVRTDVTSLRNGDVVVFESGDRLLCHRIRAIEFTGADPHVCTRGDHLSHDDPVSSAASVLGRVVTSAPPAPLAAAALRLVSRISQRPISWLLRAHGAR